MNCAMAGANALMVSGAMWLRWKMPLPAALTLLTTSCASGTNETAFNMLFMCVFVDDKESVFKFDDLVRCGVDVSTWEDFHPEDAMPFGNRSVGGL